MQAPTLEKITLNMGVGEAKQDTKMLEAADRAARRRSPARSPNVRRARKSIANFKLREGMPVGVAVTLRGARMWEFLDRLMSIAIPRIRDFRGLNPRSFDGRGNYSMGVREQIIFPEIDYDAIDEVRGLDVTITTTAPDRRGGASSCCSGSACRSRRRAVPAGSRRGDAAEEERARRRPPRPRPSRPRSSSSRKRTRGLREAGSETPRATTPPRQADDGRSRSRWPRLHRRVRQQRGRKYKTRDYNRCRRCGRSRAYYRKFGLCRICLREVAHKGYDPRHDQVELVERRCR